MPAKKICQVNQMFSALNHRISSNIIHITLVDTTINGQICRKNCDDFYG